MTKPAWVDEWIAASPDHITDEGKEWVRGRPDVIKRVMEKFPPSCVVRYTGTVPACVPTGCYGIVSGYLESTVCDAVMLAIRLDPDAEVRHAVGTDDVEVIGYYMNLTPEQVKAIIEGE